MRFRSIYTVKANNCRNRCFMGIQGTSCWRGTNLVLRSGLESDGLWFDAEAGELVCAISTEINIATVQKKETMRVVHEVHLCDCECVLQWVECVRSREYSHIYQLERRIHRIHNVADHVAWKYGLHTVIKAIDTHLTSEFWDDAQTKVEDPRRDRRGGRWTARVSVLGNQANDHRAFCDGNVSTEGCRLPLVYRVEHRATADLSNRINAAIDCAQRQLMVMDKFQISNYFMPLFPYLPHFQSIHSTHSLSFDIDIFYCSIYRTYYILHSWAGMVDFKVIGSLSRAELSLLMILGIYILKILCDFKCVHSYTAYRIATWWRWISLCVFVNHTITVCFLLSPFATYLYLHFDLFNVSSYELNAFLTSFCFLQLQKRFS